MSGRRDPALHRLTLWAQRRAGSVPVPVRRVAGRALTHLRASSTVDRPVPSEDWSVPLVPGREGADLDKLEAVADPLADPAPASPHPQPIRCVVATDVLDVGGMDEFVGFLGRRLPEMGVSTVVAYTGGRQAGTTGEGGRVVSALRAAGVATAELSPDGATDWLRSQAPDVVSAHGAPDWLLDAAVELGVPWVETLHGMHSFFHPSSWKREGERARRIRAQVAVSDLVRRQYLDRIAGFPADRITTIPNGVDERRISRVDRAAARAALGLRDEFLFLSLSRYCLQKNVYGLVAAFAEVAAAHPEAHLLVAGRADDGLYFDQVSTLAAGLPCADRVHLRGHCGNAAALLAAADGFVLDSFFEGWSLASMEALAAGVPVVMSDVGGAREQLSGGGRRGVLVGNPGGDAAKVDWRVMSELRFREQPNHAALTEAMAAMVRDRADWAADRQRLRDEAAGAFPATLCVSRHAEVLRSVVAGDPLPDYSEAATPAG